MESGFLSALAGRLLRVPTLVSLAGGELVALGDIGYGDQRLAVERLKVMTSVRLASAISAGSRMLAALAEHRTHRPVRLAPLGIDTALFTPAHSDAEPGARRVIHVGTLTPVKDHHTLIRAFAELRGGGVDASLELVGDGPLRPCLEQLTHDLGLDARVHFRGEIDHAELPRMYRAARACVLSSRHEAQGMVAIEAAACGLPLAGTCVGVLPELTRSVAPVADERALATAMAEALGAQRCGPATQLARTEFDLQTCTDRFRALYASLETRPKTLL